MQNSPSCGPPLAGGGSSGWPVGELSSLGRSRRQPVASCSCARVLRVSVIQAVRQRVSGGGRLFPGAVALPASDACTRIPHVERPGTAVTVYELGSSSFGGLRGGACARFLFGSLLQLLLNGREDERLWKFFRVLQHVVASIPLCLSCFSREHIRKPFRCPRVVEPPWYSCSTG